MLKPGDKVKINWDHIIIKKTNFMGNQDVKKLEKFPRDHIHTITSYLYDNKKYPIIIKDVDISLSNEEVIKVGD